MVQGGFIAEGFYSLHLRCVVGLPKQDDNYAYYNEQEYTDDYDYGEDDTAVNDADGALDDSLITHRPVIISESSQLDVDNGMTIRLPCNVDKLPGNNCSNLLHCDKTQ